MTTPKTKTTAADPQTPADALSAALSTFVAIAEAYANADPRVTIHAFNGEDYRVRFQSGQLLAVERM